MNVREWALPVYTILMQLAVGAFAILWLIRYLAGSKFSVQEIDRIISNPILVIAFTAVVAMGGAHFHLSKPFHSYLAVLNFKSSWLSREIVFSLLFFMSTMSVLYLTYFQTHCRSLITGLGWLAIMFGSVLIYCMARIYLIPTQVAWNSPTVVLSFYTTTLLLGIMAIACLMVLDLKFSEIKKENDVELRTQVLRNSMGGLTILTVALVALNIAITFIQIRLLAQGDLTARTSLSLLVELYLPLFVMRMVILVYASISLAVSVVRMYRLQTTPQGLMSPVYLSCLLILVGEIIGRFLFYATHIRVGL
ncbi:MAG: dimethyl sulfoxide reductase anchor subunit [Anaerolineales bacterium]|nr:dimethyl sulfoxide reductase anchor subunit [Anaerolineales bacterium]